MNEANTTQGVQNQGQVTDPGQTQAPVDPATQIPMPPQAVVNQTPVGQAQIPGQAPNVAQIPPMQMPPTQAQIPGQIPPVVQAQPTQASTGEGFADKLIKGVIGFIAKVTGNGDPTTANTNPAPQQQQPIPGQNVQIPGVGQIPVPNIQVQI